MVHADSQDKKQVRAGHEMGQSQPIRELDDDNENRKKEGHRAETPGEEKDEIEEGDHLQEDQREGPRELHGADDREHMQQGAVIAEP
jgi:hypothetical protein